MYQIFYIYIYIYIYIYCCTNNICIFYCISIILYINFDMGVIDVNSSIFTNAHMLNWILRIVLFLKLNYHQLGKQMKNIDGT